MHISKWMKPISEGYILYDSKDRTFWKRQNCEDSKKINGLQGLVGKGAMNRQDTEDF